MWKTAIFIANHTSKLNPSVQLCEDVTTKTDSMGDLMRNGQDLLEFFMTFASIMQDGRILENEY